MNFKIDTKEKFTVITPQTEHFDANIAEALWETATVGIDKEHCNVIVNLQQVLHSDAAAMNDLASLQQHFHAAKKSFVVCNVQAPITEIIKGEDLEETLNITPTESEAWDVVQMEEVERELMGDFDGNKDELNG